VKNIIVVLEETRNAFKTPRIGYFEPQRF